jgi:membrane-associated protease RseP (regulator of RpoE activity)
MIGAAVQDLLGVLPFIPVLPDGAVHPLTTAGIKPGEAVVAIREKKTGGSDLDVVSGGSAVVIALPGLTAQKPPAKAAGAVLNLLVASRIENTGDGHGFPAKDHLQVAGGDGKMRSLDLTALSEPVRDALLTGLKPGDRPVGLGASATGPELALSVIRGGTARSVAIPARDVGVAIDFGRETEPYKLTSWTEAFVIANDAAVQMVDTTLRFIPRFFKKAEHGGIDPNKALTGPVGIFNLLRKSVEVEGYAYFLKWIAIIGLNLFLINLLPIPITDGGQLTMMGIEAIIRRPLPDRARNAFMWVGLVMVGALMLYVIGLDVLRLFGVM